MRARPILPVLAALVLTPLAMAVSPLSAQDAAAATSIDSVVTPIAAPRVPLPPEDQSAGQTRFSFIVYGDTRGRYDGVRIQHEHSLVIDGMLQKIQQMATGPDPVRFVLQSGDAVVNGLYPRQWNVSFVPLIDRLTGQLGIPYFLAAGNHDIPGMDRARGLRNYLSAVSNLIPPDGSQRRLDGYPTYAFGYGNVFVLALDSNIPEDSTQLAWTEAQLQGLDRDRYTHVVAFFHHPAFSSGPHGAARVEPETAAIRALWMPMFRRYNVQMLFVGHEHLFDHWVEQYNDAAGNPHRIDQVVTGGGGAPLYPYLGEPDLSDYQRENAAAGVRVAHLARPGMEPGENPFHFVVVHVDGPNVWMEVQGVDWGRGFKPYRSNRTTIAGSGGGS